MIIGIHTRENDLVVNPIKTKKLTNIRAAGKDDALILTPPIELTLEYAVEFIADDELVEVTPKSIRIRKRMLLEHERKRAIARRRGAAGLNRLTSPRRRRSDQSGVSYAADHADSPPPDPTMPRRTRSRSRHAPVYASASAHPDIVIQPNVPRQCMPEKDCTSELARQSTAS